MLSYPVNYLLFIWIIYYLHLVLLSFIGEKTVAGNSTFCFSRTLFLPALVQIPVPCLGRHLLEEDHLDLLVEAYVLLGLVQDLGPGVGHDQDGGGVLGQRRNAVVVASAGWRVGIRLLLSVDRG